MVTFKGNAVSLKGKEINVGDSAPKVELIAGDLSAKSVGGASGKFQIINVVPFIIRRQGAAIGWKITWIISLRK